MNRSRLMGSFLLIGIVLATGTALAAWKYTALEQADAAAASQPEMAEVVDAALAEEREHHPTTTAIGTVVALRSITVRNELPGTVRRVALTPGQIVEPGTVLVALDVAVEQADLQAAQAQAEVAKTQYARLQRMQQQRVVSQMDLDRARAEADVANAQIERVRAVIERKTIRAPFRARVGIADIHPGQYLNEGTLLTTLQGIDKAAYVDFTVAQQIAAQLRPGTQLQVLPSGAAGALLAAIVAVDARVDPTTRNAMVRARVAQAEQLSPGASVRVQVPVGVGILVVAVPASAVRKGPQGDQVFVLVADAAGKVRAQARPVRIEAMSGDEALLEAGLNHGERVAASGSFKLRDQALVTVVERQPAVALSSAATTQRSQ